MNESGTPEKGPEDLGFTLDDENSLENIDQSFKNREKGEENFWALWNTMEVEHRDAYIEHIRGSIEEASEDDYPDIDFFRKVVQRWDEGDLE